MMPVRIAPRRFMRAPVRLSFANSEPAEAAGGDSCRDGLCPQIELVPTQAAGFTEP